MTRKTGGSSKIRNGKGGKPARRASQRLRRKTGLENLKCGWCGESIDITLPRTDPMSFTADHPDAVGNGGALVGQVLTPMHRRCNTLKGDSQEIEIWDAT